NRFCMHNKQRVWVAMLLFLTALVKAAEPAAVPFGSEWRFIRADEPQFSSPAFDDQGWETVTLQHTARIETLVAGSAARQWQGVCWYRKSFNLPADAARKSVVLRFDGAMNQAEIQVNGQPAGKFMGGYLPYVRHISSRVQPDEKMVISFRLDNRDNPVTGPKPLVDLD